jgi:hypothetical protein
MCSLAIVQNHAYDQTLNFEIFVFGFSYVIQLRKRASFYVNLWVCMKASIKKIIDLIYGMV